MEKISWKKASIKVIM